MNNPFLIGSKIYLRPIIEADLLPRYREWFNDPEVCSGNSHHRFPNTDVAMRKYFESVIQSYSSLVLAICDKETDAHVGNVSLLDIDMLNQSAEFAIMIGQKDYWGKGIGKEAMNLIVAHGFNELNLYRIHLGTSEDNVGMQKLALALGFKEEGHSRKAFFKNGEFKDLIQYSLLRPEFAS